ncbi:Cullin [Zopfochytrium polystomum]|nr:Cullin [Zopfochytrium polystomum]
MSLHGKRIDFPLDFLRVFADFRKELDNIYHQSGTGTFIDPYQQVRDMCMAIPKPLDDQLFDGLAEFLVDEVDRIRKAILAQSDFVAIYATSWTRYKTASFYADMICGHLNKVIRNKNKTPIRKVIPEGKYAQQRIESLAFAVWRDRLIRKLKYENANCLVYQLRDLVRQDREGKPVNQEAIRTAILSFVEVNRHSKIPLQLYVEEIESHYLSDTRSYYAAESNNLMASATISAFMQRAVERFKAETARSSKFCDSSSQEKVTKEFLTQYVAVHLKKIQSEFEDMISSEKEEDCANAYALLLRIPKGTDQLFETYESHVRQLGRNIVSKMLPGAGKDPKDIVEALVDLHDKYIAFCQKVLSSDPLFIAAVDKALRSVVNGTYDNVSLHSAEILARYCDTLLKKSPKNQQSDSEVEDKLVKMVSIFKYVDDQDVFQKFYSRMLAKRLIYGLSTSDDLELNFIAKLKETAGVEYTSKIQRMFTDMTLSSDLSKQFHTSLERRQIQLGIDLHAMVLTAGSWPISSMVVSEFQLPSQLERSAASFTNFYMEKHTGRKLSWLHHLSKADVKTFYLDKRYELNVSTFQLGVLLLFNDSTSMSVNEISAQTRLGDAELKRVLKSLTEAKLLDASLPSFDNSTIVSLNTAFTSKRIKVKIAAAVQMESAQDTENTRKSIDEDRRLFLQTVIVRVMKSRKALSHTSLIQEVIEQSRSRFIPAVPAIKKSIEQLMEKGYLERSKDEVDVYVYIA